MYLPLVVRAIALSAQALLDNSLATDCTGANATPQCSTAETLAPLLSATSLSPAAFAATLSTSSYESGNFVYTTNQSPGRAGQGTYAMLQFPYIYPYAQSIPELADQVLQRSGGRILSPQEVNFAAVESGSLSPDMMNSIRELVLDPKYAVGAAEWFLTKSEDCPRDTVTRLDDGYSGFEYYVTSCLHAGTTVDQGRKDKYCAARRAVGAPTIPECP